MTKQSSDGVMLPRSQSASRVWEWGRLCAGAARQSLMRAVSREFKTTLRVSDKDPLLRLKKKRKEEK